MIKREFGITINAYEAAEAFCGFNSEEQALFFDVVGTIADSWERGGLDFQLQYVIDENSLTKTARDTMQKIGEYGNAVNFVEREPEHNENMEFPKNEDE